MPNVVYGGILLIGLVIVSLISQILASIYCIDGPNLVCTISRWAPVVWAPVIIGVTAYLIVATVRREKNGSGDETLLSAA